jgi:hypothetical protein
MTLTEIAATCPNWRTTTARTIPRPLRQPIYRGHTCLDYAADYARRKARGISEHRRAMKARYGRTYRQRHREEILARLRRNRASGVWKVSRKGPRI